MYGLYSPLLQACHAPAHGMNAPSAQRPCYIPPSVYTQHLDPGHTALRLLHAFPLHKPVTVLRRQQRTAHKHRRLRVHAQSGQNITSSSGTDPSPCSAANTLALLELLLAQPQPLAQNSDSSASLQSDTPKLSQSHAEAAHLAPNTSPRSPEPALPAGTPAQTPARTTAQMPARITAQTSADIWTQAWQPLEAGQAAQAQQAKHAQQASKTFTAANTKNTSLPSLRFWRQQQLPNDDIYRDKQRQQQRRHTSGQQRGFSPDELPLGGPSVEAPIRNAQMYLQGIDPAARLQLLALCLAAVERQTLLLLHQNIRMSMQEWLQLCPVLLAVCSVQAGTGWLGYCPRELLEQGRQVTSCLASGCSPQGTDSSLATALSVLTQALPDQATKQEVHSPATQSPISPSSPSSSAFWRRSARKGASPAARAGNQDESSAARAGNQDESSAARAGGTAWQAAAENVGLHALVLSHMCQQGRDAQTEPDKADDPVSCSYGDLGSTQESNLNLGQQRLQPLRDSARHRLTHAPSQTNLLQSQECAKRQREDAALHQMLQAAPAILQDMAAQVAEAVAVCYLAEARSGLSEGGPAEAATEGRQWWGMHLHPQLGSTRSLERFRNQVSLSRLLHDNLHAVAAVYEDRHLLCSFGPQAQLLQRTVTARRVKELEALTGWKYTMSFLLEAADVLLPIFRSCMARVSAAISWLLVKLIGRALGLIYRGVKQSLVPQRPRHKKQDRPESSPEALQTWVPKFT